jgi:hypothetical protein
VQAAANLERALIVRQMLRMRAIAARPRQPARAEHRSVRVFLASNTDDTAAECDLLASAVWPALAALGEQHAFAITLVDARIGSSCSSMCDSELLALVYHEVLACAPWMITIVGDQYGHRPRCHPRWAGGNAWLRDLVRKYPAWLKARGSISEFAVLVARSVRPSAYADRSFFYLRRAAGLSRTERAAMMLADAQGSERLVQLRALIKTEWPTAWREYSELSSFRELATDDMRRALLHDFGEEHGLHTEQFADHARFAFSKADEHCYEISADAQQALASFHRLLVVGRCGAGKSVCLSRIARHPPARMLNSLVFFHSAQARAVNQRLAFLVHRMCSFIKHACHAPNPLPSDEVQLVESLPWWLQLASDFGGVLVVIDAIELLESTIYEPAELDWLPMFLPANVRVVCSVDTGKEATVGTCRKRGWSVLDLDRLRHTDRSAIVRAFLARNRLSLKSAQIDGIARLCSPVNTGMLHFLLHELGSKCLSHDPWVEISLHYLQASTLCELGQLALQRIENDFLWALNGQLGAMMGVLALSSNGLSVGELASISDVDVLHVIAILQIAPHILTEVNGIVAFAHRELQAAAAQRYLVDAAQVRSSRCRIIKTLSALPLSARSSEDIGNQHFHMGNSRHLCSLMTDIDAACALIRAGRISLVSRWWAWLRSNEVLQSEFDPGKVLLSLLWARSSTADKTDPSQQNDRAYDTLAGFFDLVDTELASQIRLHATVLRRELPQASEGA